MKLHYPIIFSILIFSCSDKDTLKREGIQLFNDKKYNESIKKFEEYLKTNDTSETVLLLHANANHAICENRKSINDYYKLINQSSNNWIYYYNLAMLHYLDNRLDSAAIFFEESYKKGSNIHFGSYLLLNCYFYGKAIVRDSIGTKFKIDSLLNHSFAHKNYYNQYMHFEEEFSNKQIYNLSGCSQENYTYLNWLPKKYSYIQGDTVEGFLFLMGFLKTQQANPEFYLLSDTKQIIKKIEVKDGICRFSFQTDTLNLQIDSVTKEYRFGARIKYLNSSGLKKDSMFYLNGTVPVKKKNIS